jgi:hypothetical protein
MENKSRFCHYLYLHRGVDAGYYGCKTTEHRSTDSPLPPSIKCYVLRESLTEDSQNIPCLHNTKEKGVVGNLYISLVFLNAAVAMGSHIDHITIKTPNPICRLYWCLLEFIDWRYSQSCWYFRPLCVI